MRNPSKKTLKHMARIALSQNDPYNPINRNIRKWEKMFPKLAARERWRFFYFYYNTLETMLDIRRKRSLYRECERKAKR